jgi:hypothetical protein
VPYPSTEKSRAASRVAGWKSGKYASVLTAGEVFEERLSMIEGGRIGTDAERSEVQRLLQALQAEEDLFTLERVELEGRLRDLVLGMPEKAALGRRVKD